MFSNKTVLITGGTGSFGSTVLEKFIHTNIKEIRILSRDEKKQDDIRKKYANEKIKFLISDVRDYQSIEDHFIGVDFVFHAAALKQVPSCEFFPLEAVKTNILGTENVLNAAIKNGVKKVICLSTDKAVYPINAMGTSKAMMEKIILAKSKTTSNTKICITRYGNVIASRGSVIPLFIDQIKTKGEITITNPNMTRFMMSLDEAVSLVLYAFENGDSGELFIYKSPGATIQTLGKALFSLTNKKEKVKVIGVRHGEKDHEVLLSKEEKYQSMDLDNFYKVSPDVRELNYENYFSEGRNLEKIEEYNSKNTNQLSVEDLIEMLKKNKEVAELLKNL